MVSTRRYGKDEERHRLRDDRPGDWDGVGRQSMEGQQTYAAAVLKI